MDKLKIYFLLLRIHEDKLTVKQSVALKELREEIEKGIKQNDQQ